MYVHTYVRTYIHTYMHSVPTQFFDYDQILLVDPLWSWWLHHGHCGGGHWYGFIQCAQQSIWASGVVVYNLGRGEGKGRGRGGGEEGRRRGEGEGEGRGGEGEGERRGRGRGGDE